MTSAWVIRSNLSMLVKSIFLGSIPASIFVGRTTSTFYRPKRGRGDPSPDMKSSSPSGASSPWVMPTMLALMRRASLRPVCTATSEKLLPGLGFLLREAQSRYPLLWMGCRRCRYNLKGMFLVFQVRCSKYEAS